MPPFAVFVLDFIVPFLSQIGTSRKNFSKKGLNYACFFPYVVESIFPNFEICPSNDGIFCPFIIEGLFQNRLYDAIFFVHLLWGIKKFWENNALFSQNFPYVIGGDATYGIIKQLFTDLKQAITTFEQVMLFNRHIVCVIFVKRLKTLIKTISNPSSLYRSLCG